MNSIGKNIRTLRKALNLTQNEFAKKYKISRSYLGDLENNRRNPSAETIKKLSKSIGISTMFLLEGTPSLTDSIVLGDDFFSNQPSTYSESQEELIKDLLIDNSNKALKKVNDLSSSETDLFKLAKIKQFLDLIEIESNSSCDLKERKIAHLTISILSVSASFLNGLETIRNTRGSKDHEDYINLAEDELEIIGNLQSELMNLMTESLKE